MYTEYFGFRENPFSEKHDVDYFFLNDAIKQLYQNIITDIYQGINLSLLLGDWGIGKTAFFQQLIGLDPFQLKVIYLHATHWNDLTDQLCKIITPGANSPDANKQKLLADHFTTLHRQGISPVLIVDNAQELDDNSLASILQLSEQLIEERPLLQVILATVPEFLVRFDLPTLQPFKPLISRQYQLDTLTLAEVREFINLRLRQAGCTHENLFTNDAIRIIAARSRGVPRLIIKLCGAALLQASLNHQHTINEETVEAASTHCLLAPNSERHDATANTQNKSNSLNQVSTNSGSRKPNENSLGNKTLAKPSNTWVMKYISFGSIAAATILLLFGTLIIFNINPNSEAENENERLKIAQSNIIQERKNLTLPTHKQQKKNHLLKINPPQRIANVTTELAHDTASFKPPNSRELIPTSPATTKKNKPTSPESVIDVPKNSSQIRIQPLQKSTIKPKNVQTTSKKVAGGKSKSTLPENQGPKKLTFTDNNQAQLSKREQLAKKRAEARLKLYQSGIEFGIEALMAAATTGDNRTLALLFTGGIPANLQEPTHGFTALTIAAGYGHNDTIKFLILKSGAAVNIKNYQGRTALMAAAESGHSETVDILLNNGAKVDQQDEDGWTSLMFAAYNNHVKTTYVLLDWGANYKLRNNAGRTAMQIARTRGNTEIIKLVNQKYFDKTSEPDPHAHSIQESPFILSGKMNLETPNNG